MNCWESGSLAEAVRNLGMELPNETGTKTEAEEQIPSDSDAVHYNDRLDAHLQLDTEEKIASHIFANTDATEIEANDIGKSILAMVLVVFRPDLIASGKPQPGPNDTTKPKWHVEYATTVHAVSKEEAFNLAEHDFATRNCVARAEKY